MIWSKNQPCRRWLMEIFGCPTKKHPATTLAALSNHLGYHVQGTKDQIGDTELALVTCWPALRTVAPWTSTTRHLLSKR